MKINKPDGYVRVAFPSFDGVTKTKWVTELRSGIPQTVSILKDTDGECCLGVLCRLQNRLKIDELRIWRDGNQSYWLSEDNLYTKFFNTNAIFPKDCYVTNNKRGEIPTPFYNLGDCNDNGCSFEQIAEIIDAFWYDPETETP